MSRRKHCYAGRVVRIDGCWAGLLEAKTTQQGAEIDHLLASETGSNELSLRGAECRTRLLFCLPHNRSVIQTNHVSGDRAPGVGVRSKFGIYPAHQHTPSLVAGITPGETLVRRAP
eukprot:2552227-Rhodomonas_salina.3